MKRLLFIILFGVSIYAISQAATTGVTGATAFNISAVWTQGDSALAASGSDDRRALHAGAGTTNQLELTSFGFTIPDGSTITDITVALEGQGSAAQAARRRITGQLTKDGSTGTGDNPFVSTPRNSDAIATYVPATDQLWGVTWTVSEINSSNFGVILTHTQDEELAIIRVDYMTVNVTYTLGGGLSGRRRRIQQQSSPGGVPTTRFLGYE